MGKDSLPRHYNAEFYGFSVLKWDYKPLINISLWFNQPIKLNIIHQQLCYFICFCFLIISTSLRITFLRCPSSEVSWYQTCYKHFWRPKKWNLNECKECLGVSWCLDNHIHMILCVWDLFFHFEKNI